MKSSMCEVYNYLAGTDVFEIFPNILMIRVASRPVSVHPWSPNEFL